MKFLMVFLAMFLGIFVLTWFKDPVKTDENDQHGLDFDTDITLTENEEDWRYDPAYSMMLGNIYHHDESSE